MLKIIKNNVLFLKYIKKASKGRITLAITLSILDAFVGIVLEIYLLKFILDSIQLGRSLKEVILVVTIIILLALVEATIMDWYNNIFVPVSDTKIKSYINNKLFEKVSSVDLSFYDKSENYDSYVRAIRASEDKPIAVLNQLVGIFKSVVTLIALIAIIATMDTGLLIFAIVPTLFSLPLSIIRNKYNYKIDKDLTNDNRKVDYVKKVFYEKRFAKDIRSTGIKNIMIRNCNNAYSGLIAKLRKYGLKKWLLGFWESFNQLVIVLYASYVYLIYRVLTKSLTTGDFTAMFSAVRNVDRNLRIIMQIAPSLQENSLYIENFNELINYENKVVDGKQGLALNEEDFSIRFSNVSFRYDSDSELILKNINLEFSSGEKIAIVGHNGAGKTTLIKLLLRFYDPEEGEITINDINIKNFEIHEYRNIYSTVYQDFNIYPVSVGENVIMDVYENMQENKIDEVLKLSGLEENIMVEDRVTKEFYNNGIVLSGGQSQKLAIARAYMKNSPIFIMDEPSSSLDPIAEYNLYQQMMKISKGKSVIFISHRLSSTFLADRIIFLENGEIKEVGSHKELMNLDGKYADMYKKQAEKYSINS